MSKQARSLLALGLFVAAACSRVPPGEVTSGEFGPAPGSQGTSAAQALGPGPSAVATGSLRAGVSGAARVAPSTIASVPGIDAQKRTIKVVFHMKLEACGDDATACPSLGLAGDRVSR